MFRRSMQAIEVPCLGKFGEPAPVRGARRSGGRRNWDNKIRRWCGDHYEVRPDELVTELNGAGDCEQITALLKRYRALKR